MIGRVEEKGQYDTVMTEGSTVPEFWTYTRGSTTYTAGQSMPAPQVGDEYTDGIYTYKFGYCYVPHHGGWETTDATGWGVKVNDNTRSSYYQIALVLNGKPVQFMNYTFFNCNNLLNPPTIPETIIDMTCTFYWCKQFSGDIVINANPIRYNGCFADTVKPIALSGTSSLLNELAATSSAGNVTVK